MTELGNAYRLRPDVRYRNIGGEGVLLCQEAAEVIGVNELGVRVVELIDSDLGVEAVVERLRVEFDAPQEALSRDVRRYIDELVDAGVLERRAQAPGASGEG